MAPLPRIPLAFKRLGDIWLSLLGLIVLAPLFVVLWVLVRLTLGSPVLFRQERHGLRERPFTIIKFRTMRDPAGPESPAVPDGQRVTRIGEFLRKTSLDELPELWNVLKGEMSLVGPRPLLVRYSPYFEARERLRFEVRPGMTGWAQINGRNFSPWDERLENDAWYVEHWSLWLDFRILCVTPLKVLKRSEVVTDQRTIMRNLDEERDGRAGA